MLEISNNTIRFTRGDTVRLEITVSNPDGTVYKIKDGDLIEFTVKKNTDSEIEIIKKSGTEIVIEPEETAELDYGIYVYDVQLILSNGDIDTVIPPSEFIVLEEVNHAINRSN